MEPCPCATFTFDRSIKTKPEDPKGNSMADLDKNWQVDIVDITMVAIDFGKTV